MNKTIKDLERYMQENNIIVEAYGNRLVFTVGYKHEYYIKPVHNNDYTIEFPCIEYSMETVDIKDMNSENS